MWLQQLAGSRALSWPKPDSWMVIPRADSSPSNCFTAGEISVFSDAITAHSKFSLSSRVVICH